jgi:hypothetical protein
VSAMSAMAATSTAAMAATMTATMTTTTMAGMNSGSDDRGVVIVAVGIIIIWGVIVRVRVIVRIVIIAVWIIVPVPRISRARCQSENQAQGEQIARPHCHHLSGFPGVRPGPALSFMCLPTFMTRWLPAEAVSYCVIPSRIPRKLKTGR